MELVQKKRKFPQAGVIYVILDKEVIDKEKLNIFLLADKLAGFGVDIFQFRVKNMHDKELLLLSQKLAEIIHKKGKTFIINDRPDMAYLCQSDGLHLGKNDMPVKSARKVFGEKKIIGKTVHSLKELISFQNEDIDYVSIGVVFKTATKPELAPLSNDELSKILKSAIKPVFAIGGINEYNVDYLVSLGIKNIAICRGIILSKNFKKTVYNIKKCLLKKSSQTLKNV